MSSRPDRRAIAFHEAGHAVLAWQNAKPGSVSAVLISTETGSGGFTWCDLAGAAPWQRYSVAIAGPLATAVFAAQRGLSIENVPAEDDQAAGLVPLRQTLEGAGAQMGGTSEPLYMPDSLASIEAGRPRSIEAQTLKALRQHWAAVEDIAVTLEGHGRIGPRQLTQIMRAHGVQRHR